MAEPNTESERALRHRAEQLSSLDAHGGFQLLVEATKAKAERMKQHLLARLMAGEDIEGNLQRQVDYDRGFVDGMQYNERVVAGATRKLKDLDEGAESEPDEEEDGWALIE